MSCRSPRTVGFQADGKTISWSQKNYSKEYATFQLPCGKCLECRLDYARQWAIRCMHEAKMHDRNAFITLTYDDAHLESPRLDYSHFQDFMKRLRHEQEEPIGCFVTGEYGEKTKRPHWHALIFNWSLPDPKIKRSNERGDKLYSSEVLDEIWGKGNTETGEVTFESAGYVARYASKKLCHGNDSDHDFHPISKKSSKYAIGKKWIEKFYFDVFNEGKLILPNGNSAPIPRYYEKWLQKHHHALWYRYVTEVKPNVVEVAASRAKKEEKLWRENEDKRRLLGIHDPSKKKNQVMKEIQRKKFNLLQALLKL